MGLDEAYHAARSIIERDGALPVESFAVAQEVERLQCYWRPECVRVILLLESHVWTSDEEFKSKVRQPDGVETSFMRFLYCLGYEGTPQFWRLLHDTVRGPEVAHDCVLKTAGQRHCAGQRLNLLEAMKANGVWLVDASVTALYRPGGKRVISGRPVVDLLNACWENHVREVVISSSPSCVLLIGKQYGGAIERAVRNAVPSALVETLQNPNARMTSEELAGYRQKVFSFCQGSPCGL